MKLPPPHDPLLLLLLQIARRADELAPDMSGNSVEPWLRAEREICGPGLPAPSFPVPDGIRAA